MQQGTWIRVCRTVEGVSLFLLLRPTETTLDSVTGATSTLAGAAGQCQLEAKNWRQKKKSNWIIGKVCDS